jgi:hypothetical protein
VGKKKEIHILSFRKKEPEKFGFDVTKVDKIFDLLLQEIKNFQFHSIPSA